jgi:hypothetical protein
VPGKNTPEERHNKKETQSMTNNSIWMYPFFHNQEKLHAKVTKKKENKKPYYYLQKKSHLQINQKNELSTYSFVHKR